MSPARRGLLVALVAVLGIALAAAITWGTSQLVRQRIGLASEPLSAGRRLLPPVASTPAQITKSSTATTSTTRAANSTQSSPARPTTTPTSPAPPTSTSSVPAPSAPTGAPVESTPPVVRGHGDGGGDSGSHRDD